MICNLAKLIYKISKKSFHTITIPVDSIAPNTHKMASQAYMYINTCGQGYQTTSFKGKYKEYLFSPNNICIEIINYEQKFLLHCLDRAPDRPFFGSGADHPRWRTIQHRQGRCHCIQQDYCIKHASAERSKLPQVELIICIKKQVLWRKVYTVACIGSLKSSFLC